MEFEILIDSPDSFIVYDKHNKNNRVFVIKRRIPIILPPYLKESSYLERWEVMEKSFSFKEHALEYAKEFLKMKDTEHTQDNTKELKAIREKVRFLSYIISLVQEDPDLSKNYVMALSEIKKYIDRIIYGEN